MKINGTATLNAPRDRVWAALNDPAVLVRTIPGCERLEALGDDRYRMTVTAGVASIKGTYLGEVAPDRPGAAAARSPCRPRAPAHPGRSSADVRVTLDGRPTTARPCSATPPTPSSAAPSAGSGQRVLAGVAKKTAGEFFKAVDAALAEPAGVRPVPGPAGRRVAGDRGGRADRRRGARGRRRSSDEPAARSQRVFSPPAAPDRGGRQVHVDVATSCRACSSAPRSRWSASGSVPASGAAAR